MLPHNYRTQGRVGTLLVVFVLSRKPVSGLAAIPTVDLQITNLVCNLHRRRIGHAQSPLGFVQRWRQG